MSEKEQKFSHAWQDDLLDGTVQNYLYIKNVQIIETEGPGPDQQFEQACIVITPDTWKQLAEYFKQHPDGPPNYF